LSLSEFFVVLSVGAWTAGTTLAADGTSGQIASRDVGVEHGMLNQPGTYLVRQSLLKCFLSLSTG